MKAESKKYIDDIFTMFDMSLGEKGYRWLDSDDFVLDSSKSFINSFNQLQLVFNYSSNLSLAEDYRRECGMTDYGITIPTEQFRFPSLNNQNFYVPLKSDEEQLIEKIKNIAKKHLHYGKDESLIDEMNSRFEFLTLYSCFEGFCEELINEKTYANDEKTIKKNGDFIRHNDLLKIVEKVFSFYSSDVLGYLKQKYAYFEKISRLFYELRNLYTHRNGMATKWFINRGLNEPKFLSEWIFDKKLNKQIYVIDCITGNYQIFEGRNINCQLIVTYFRVYVLLIVELLNYEEE